MTDRTVAEGGFESGQCSRSLPAGRNSAHDTLICFSHLRWDFVFQRPQHILSRAARDYRVLYFEEPILEEERRFRPFLETVTLPTGITRLIPHLPASFTPRDRTAALRRLLDQVLPRKSAAALIGWYYTPMSLEFSAHLDFDVCLYDCMDELSAFKGAPHNLKHEEDRLLARADTVFTGGLSLFDAKSKRHDNVHVFPSSVDRAHFAPAREVHADEPADIADIPHPRIGYFGVIDERLNYDLLDALSIAAPDWHFVMIGPNAKVEESELPKRKNIHWLGCKPYSRLPHYLAFLDVGFMPFAINAATRYISPTKTPEFLAAGLPVVSTPVQDVVRTYGRSGLVEVAETLPQLIVALQNALALHACAPAYTRWLASADRHLSTMSWDATWADMQKQIHTELASARVPATPLTRIPAYGTAPNV